MRSNTYISPELGSTKGGGGPEDDPRYPNITLRRQGFLALAFGFALGISLVIIYLLLKLPLIPEQAATILPELQDKISLTLLLYFCVGFIAGSLIAAFYNLLVVRRLNFFGLESHMD